ncbi:unnamed protein product [Protopolystoma xenopodis]|uniref:Uncharacterized protein n=1 Tax=Protopolystoma xenopodis TaxID=117903 RepID=A0A448WVE6_9PLAT|nr:unnamed protein product [Protopolystoma xenopodis]
MHSLDQPEPCHISCLVFGPLDEGPYGPAQIFSDLGLRPSLSSSPGPDVSCEFRRKSTKSSEQTANDIPSAEQLLTPAEQLCQALYVVDAAGWLYQLSPDRRFKATRIPLSRVPHCSIRS